MLYFEYGDAELNHLQMRDPRLGAAIKEIGLIKRSVHPDLYTSLMRALIGQQISTKAAATVWRRREEALGSVTPEHVYKTDAATIQRCGMTMRKAENIKDLSAHILNGTLDLNQLRTLSDQEVCLRLATIKGIGVWTAEMLLTFCLQRPDIMSWDDLAIHRGLRMLYRHRRITKALFAKYRRRYSPYASVASIYLWAIAAGKCVGLTDPAPKKVKSKTGTASRTARITKVRCQ